MTREEAQKIIDAAFIVNEGKNDAEICVNLSLGITGEHIVDVMVFDSRDNFEPRNVAEHFASYWPDAGTPAEMVERIMKYNKAVTK